MAEDSSTCRDWGAGSYRKYADMIYDTMPRKEFVRAVKMYISEFKLPGHLQFTDAAMGKLDYAVTRYGNALYVTNASVNSLLRKGDKIVAINSKSIEDTASENRTFLMDEPIERQTCLWDQILMFSENVTVQRDKNGQILVPTVLSKAVDFQEAGCYFEVRGGNRLYIRIADFYDDKKLKEILENALPYLERCEELIMDVRGNRGGSDSAFYSLLEYCFPPGEHRIYESGLEINYSERNCESRLRIFREFFGDDLTPELKRAIDLSTENLLSKKGMGFLREADEELILTGKSYPLKVEILTDECCCSAGEYFVELASKSPKVSVVGRPTMGINDYSNCTNAIWDDFYLAYPTSRNCRIDSGEGLQGKGVPVDVYVKWTPALLGAGQENRTHESGTVPRFT